MEVKRKKTNQNHTSSEERIFTYQKPKLYLACLFYLLMAGFAGYVLTKGNTEVGAKILTWSTAVTLILLALRCIARAQEKIVLAAEQISWVRLLKTTDIQLTQINGLDSYVSIDGVGVEVKGQSGQKICFTTEITGFFDLCREVKKRLYVH